MGAIAANSENDSARVTACVHLLDRGWGKPEQPIEGKIDTNIEIVIRNIIRGETSAMKTIEASYTKKDNDDDQSG